MRRFLLHVLPRGFHRIRHYGLLGNAHRRENLARARALLAAPPPPTPITDTPDTEETPAGAQRTASRQPTHLARKRRDAQPRRLVAIPSAGARFKSP
jgi:hypothetical protein